MLRIGNAALLDDELLEEFALFDSSNMTVATHLAQCSRCEERARVLAAFLHWLGDSPEWTQLSSGLAGSTGSEYYVCTGGKVGPLLGLTPQALAEAKSSLRVARTTVQRGIPILTNRNCSPEDLYSVLESDPVLAAGVVRAANSPVFAARKRVATIQHAVQYVGADRTRQLMLASIMRGCFAGSQGRDLWAHSVRVAEYAEAVANRSGAVDPSVAFSSALLHDIGRIVMLHFARGSTNAMALLVSRGCPSRRAEQLLFGQDHAELGSELLSEWQFPEVVSEAILHHHRSEAPPSELARLLFLTEAIADNSTEAFVSDEEVAKAARHFGVTPREVPKLPRTNWTDILRMAA